MDAYTGTLCSYSRCGPHSVTSAHVDIRIDNNGTWMDAFVFGKQGDTTWDFTGQSFEADVQLSRYDATPLLHLDSASGKIVVDDIVQRVLHFNVDPATLQAALNPGTYVFDFVMVDGSSPPVRVPLMHGFLFVNQGVTYP